MARKLQMALGAVLAILSAAMGESASAQTCTVNVFTIAAINTAITGGACQEIILPSGIYTEASYTNITITQSNLYIHGGRGVGSVEFTPGVVPSGTVLQFSYGGGIVVGDTTTNTYAGDVIEGVAVEVTSGTTALTVNANAVGGEVLHSRFTRYGTSSTGGIGVDLKNNAYMWTFADVLVDYFVTGYELEGNNNWLSINRGQIRSNTTGVLTSSTVSSQDVLLDGVDIEGNGSIGVDVQSAIGFKIDGCYFDTGAFSGTLGVRVGASSSYIPESVQLHHNYFNGHCLPANTVPCYPSSPASTNYNAYAVELDGFSTLTMSDNTFQSYGDYNVHNTYTHAVAGGWFENNDTAGLSNANMISALNGFDLVANGGVANGGSTIMRLARPQLGGNAVVAGDFTLTAGWGSTASVSVLPGSKDTSGSVSINPSGRGISQGVNVKLTFHDGTWTSNPFCNVGITGGGSPTNTGLVRISSASATYIDWYWEGTPSSGNVMDFTWMCVSSN